MNWWFIMGIHSFDPESIQRENETERNNKGKKKNKQRNATGDLCMCMSLANGHPDSRWRSLRGGSPRPQPPPQAQLNLASPCAGSSKPSPAQQSKAGGRAHGDSFRAGVWVDRSMCVGGGLRRDSSSARRRLKQEHHPTMPPLSAAAASCRWIDPSRPFLLRWGFARKRAGLVVLSSLSNHCAGQTQNAAMGAVGRCCRRSLGGWWRSPGQPRHHQQQQHTTTILPLHLCSSSRRRSCSCTQFEHHGPAHA